MPLSPVLPEKRGENEMLSNATCFLGASVQCGVFQWIVLVDQHTILSLGSPNMFTANAPWLSYHVAVVSVVLGCGRRARELAHPLGASAPSTPDISHKLRWHYQRPHTIMTLVNKPRVGLIGGIASPDLELARCSMLDVCSPNE